MQRWPQKPHSPSHFKCRELTKVKSGSCSRKRGEWMTEACEQPIICRRNRVDDKADSIDLSTPRKRKRAPNKPPVPLNSDPTRTRKTIPLATDVRPRTPGLCLQQRRTPPRPGAQWRPAHSGATRRPGAPPSGAHSPGGPQRTRGPADRPYLAWRASNSPWSPEVRLSTSRCSDSCTSARSASR